MNPPLRPYPETRDSGAAWLGRVPTHWAVRSVKRVFSIVGGATPKSGEPRYWDGDVVWVTPADVSRAPSLGDSARRITEEGRRSCSTELVPSRSLVVTSRAPVGNVAIAATSLCTNQGCKALVPGGDAEPLFHFHVLTVLKEELESRAVGTTFAEISTDRLASVPIPVPPLAEQRSIARFLDHSCRRIGRYLAAKERLIELLEEQKQAVIRRAVTRGLDPTVPHKPSGIEWLGDIPAHWMVAALHLRYSQVLGKMLDSKRITGRNQVPYLRNVDVQWDRINVADLPTMDVAESEYARYAVEPGDLLVCEGGEVGRCAIWTGELGRCIFQKALHRLRPRRVADDLPRFLYYALRAAKSGGAFESGFVSTIAHLTGERLRAHRFPFPPGAEQQAIVAHLDRATAALDAAIARTRRQRELVAEYRTRLVADVATGKLDVREAAPRLPADPDDGDDAGA